MAVSRLIKALVDLPAVLCDPYMPHIDRASYTGVMGLSPTGSMPGLCTVAQPLMII